MSSNIKINKDSWTNNQPSSNQVAQVIYKSFDHGIHTINEKLRNTRGIDGFSYNSIDAQLKKANELLETLCYYIGGTLDDINDIVDEPFFERFNNRVGIQEGFERIKLDDYKTRNQLGIKEHGVSHTYDYPSGTYKSIKYELSKDEIGIKDLLNNMEVKGHKGMPSFTEMMRNVHDEINTDMSYEEYVDGLVHRADITHTVDRGWLNQLSDVLDTVGIVSAVSIFTGENFITKEILTESERSNAVFNTVVNVSLLALTVVTAGGGSIAAVGTKAAIHQAGKIVVKSLAVDMVSGAAGLATINLLDAMGSPEALSKLAGLGESFLGGYVGSKAVSKFSNVGDSVDDAVKGASGAGKNIDDIITDGSHYVDGKLKPNSTYKSGEHDYIYKTNEDGLISKAHTDDLKLKTHDGRLKHNAKTPGKIDGDHAGHLFGDRFGGSPELDNLVSQAKEVNLSKYKIIENDWADALKEGKSVSVDISVDYIKGTSRPISFSVSYTIDGEDFFEFITN